MLLNRIFKFSALLFALVFFAAAAMAQTTYYSQGDANFSVLSNWNTERDGTGVAPAGFNTNTTTWIVQNGHDLTVNSILDLGEDIGGQVDAVTLTIESGGTITMSAGGTFNEFLPITDVNVYGTYTHNGGISSLESISIFNGGIVNANAVDLTASNISLYRGGRFIHNTGSNVIIGISRFWTNSDNGVTLGAGIYEIRNHGTSPIDANDGSVGITWGNVEVNQTTANPISFTSYDQTIADTLNIISGAVNLGTGRLHSVRALLLNGTGQLEGTWGSTGSTATNKNNTYFLSSSSGRISVTNCSAVASLRPTVSSPICNSATSVSGTSTEANGSVVTVFRSGSSIGTTTVSGGSWTLTGISLSTGNQITATVRASGKCISPASLSVTVVRPPTVATPATPSALCSGGSYSPTTPSVNANGSSVTSQGWQIETGVSSGSYTSLTVPYTVAFADNGKRVRYFATNGCGTTNSSTVTLTVNNVPTVATPATPSALCDGGSYNPTAPSVTANGSTVTSQGWQIETGVSSGSYTSLTVAYTVAFADNGKRVRYFATNGCGTTNSSTVTLTVNQGPTVNAGSSLSAICQGAESQQMGGSVGGGATGGTWSGGAGSWTNANNPSTATYTAGASESGSITLTLTTSGGSCGTTFTTKSITVNPTMTAGAASSTPTVLVNNALSPSITHSTTVATGIGSTTGLPAGVTANWSSDVITISGTPTDRGVYNYSIPLTGGCGSVNATGTITVRKDYRTKGTATFNNASQWEVDNGTTYTQASVAPSSSNDVEILHPTTMDVNFTTGSGKTLSISSIGTLTINPNIIYTITGSADFGGKSVTLKSTSDGTASIGRITGSLTGATNVTVERYIPAALKWRGLAVPLSNASGNNNSIKYNWQNNGGDSTGKGVLLWSSTATAGDGFSFNPNENSSQNIRKFVGGTGFSLLSNTDEPLFGSNKPIPYLVFVTQPHALRPISETNETVVPKETTLSSNGTLYQGSYLSGSLASGFHMIPNPYPAAIDFTLVNRGSGLENMFWIWDPKLNLGTRTFGGYQTYSAGVLARPGGSYTEGEKSIIPSGTAFWVYSNGDGSISMTESSKKNSSSSVSVFGRVAEDKNQVLRVNLLSANDAFLLDGVAASFRSDASDGIDKMDARKFGLTEDNVYLLRNNQKLAIEFHPILTKADTLFIGLNKLSKKTYRLQIMGESLETLTNTTAVLEDLYAKTERVLNLSGVNDINFTIDDQPASNGDRFRIVFRQNVITRTEDLNLIKGFQIYPNPVSKGSSFQLQFKQQPAGTYQVTLFDMVGARLLNRVLQHPGGSANHSVQISDKISAGNYLLQISDSNGVSEQNKIIIQ
ncbi:MAG: T9SS type A sorting domain-containing protein [Bacteroidetes bacterium]|nr:T9SS type A sorting domain-containing protein [Bacteroidota bacterium]